ncbi:branched-chain amino acid ABC transporter permease [Deltaproteobacteria bacterium PRO3]|nr:branched-chain amino acid ABC transporter permease [Deltaproteobacteria bacterium PRO3]
MKRLLAVLLCVAVLWGLNRAFDAYLNPYYLQILVYIGINVVMATSLNLINGYTGQFNLGHAGFMAVGAYASAAFSVYAHPALRGLLGFLPATALDPLLFLVSLAVGVCAAILSGLAIGLPTLRLRGDYLAIATLGFGEIVLVVINNMEVVGGARGFSDIPGYANFFWVFLFAALTVYVIGRITRTAKGLSFAAIREDEIAALSLGISNTRVKVTAFVIGAGFAGLGGGLYAHYLNYLHVNSFGFLKSVDFVVMVVLGGMGNLWGVVIAAALLTMLPELLRGFAEWRMILYSLLIIATMLLRSKGVSIKQWVRSS